MLNGMFFAIADESHVGWAREFLFDSHQNNKEGEVLGNLASLSIYVSKHTLFRRRLHTSFYASQHCCVVEVRLG